MGKGKDVTTGYWYSLGVHMVLCHGPVDAIKEIRAGDRTAWTGNVTANQSVNIIQPELFGGEKKEGGISGYVDFCFGETTQTPNAYLGKHLTAPIPAFRGVAALVVNGAKVAANNPYIKPWSVKVSRILKGWHGGAAWNTTKAAVGTDGDMNPAHIIYQCLTDPNWGMGYPATAIDTVSFGAAADALYAEGFGLSFLWNNQSPVGEFIQQVVNHIGAILYADPQTGKFALKLIRDDYNPATLALFDTTNTQSLDDFQRATWGETINEITVVYSDRTTGKPSAITVQDLASVTSQAAVINQTKQYPGIHSATLAARVAMRDLRSTSTPLAKIKIKINRQAWNLIPGQVFKFSWPAHGINSVVFRVLQVNGGTLAEGAISVEAVEDVFGLPASSYVAQVPTSWVDPSTIPAPCPAQKLVEASYWDIVRTVAPADRAFFTDTTSFMRAIGNRPASDAVDYALQSMPGGGTLAEVARGQFTPTCTIIGAMVKETTSTIEFENEENLDLVKLGTYALVDNELMAVTAIDGTALTVTFYRGVLDTVPEAHAAGSRIWFYDRFAGDDPTEYASGENVYAKLLPRTGRGQLDPASATQISTTMTGRWVKPYAPGKFQIKALYYPDAIEDYTIPVTWAHRDRTLQTATLIDQTYGNIGPEASTTYTVRFYSSTGALLHAAGPLTSTSYSWAPPTSGVPYKVELESQRGTYISHQKHSHTVTFTSLAEESPTGGILPKLYDGTKMIGTVQLGAPTYGTVVAYSTDSGVTWTTDTDNIGLGSSSITMTYGLSKWVINGGSVGNWFGYATAYNGAWTTDDITSFPVANVGGAVSFCPHIFDGTRFVVGGQYGIVMTSTNGTSWAEVTSNTLQDSADGGKAIKGLAFDGTNYFAHVYDTLSTTYYQQIWKSTDRATWTKVYEYSSTTNDRDIRKLRYLNGAMFACGAKLVSGATRPWLLQSTDGGATWNDVSPVPSSGNPFGMSSDDLAYFAGKYVLFGGNLEGYSSDLVTWTLTEPTTSQSLYSPVQDATAMVAVRLVGSPPTYGMRRTTDGMTWADVTL
jgi:hypothetical protein